jgi:hypothetical protein
MSSGLSAYNRVRVTKSMLAHSEAPVSSTLEGACDYALWRG